MDDGVKYLENGRKAAIAEAIKWYFQNNAKPGRQTVNPAYKKYKTTKSKGEPNR